MLDWLTSPKWSGDLKSVLLTSVNDNESNEDVSLSKLIEESSRFPVNFPVDTVRCYQLKTHVSEKLLESNISSTYPVIHEYGLYLCSIFLLYQRKHGLRKEFYEKLSLTDFIDRFLSKRAVIFMDYNDRYLLINGCSGWGNWEKIGTEKETHPLTLENCLSYDEIKLSALLSVSSNTCFINDGDRHNCGRRDRENIEEGGVIIGAIGTRLEKPNVMEYCEVMKTKDQNKRDNGYGKFEIPTVQSEFLKFYGDSNETYDEMLEKMESMKDRYVDLGDGKYFDKLMYERRISISIDTILIEANARAKEVDSKAYIHVVGLGLGVWKIYSGQNSIFMDTFAKRLEILSNVLTHVSDVRFAYIHQTRAGKYKHGDKINGIKIHIEDKNPQVKLTGDDEGKLLVVSYPWDGNALPGNEFWIGSLSGSGDPAAASSTQVAELHNWYINRKLRGKNLRVATFNGLVSFEEYQQLHKGD